MWYHTKSWKKQNLIEMEEMWLPDINVKIVAVCLQYLISFFKKSFAVPSSFKWERLVHSVHSTVSSVLSGIFKHYFAVCNSSSVVECTFTQVPIKYKLEVLVLYLSIFPYPATWLHFWGDCCTFYPAMFIWKLLLLCYS